MLIYCVIQIELVWWGVYTPQCKNVLLIYKIHLLQYISAVTDKQIDWLVPGCYSYNPQDTSLYDFLKSVYMIICKNNHLLE